MRKTGSGASAAVKTKAEMDEKWGVGEWLPLPRFEIVQASGKKRPIDDGARLGHNAASGFEETIECCSALQPAVHAKLLFTEASLQGREPEMEQERLETGGEDLPDAYRWIPAAPTEGALNIVSVYDPEAGECRFQEVYGQVFGKAGAVVNFHRPQRLLVACARRWLMLMFSMYYDDGSLTDVGRARGRGQRALRAMFRLAGLPFAEAKQVDLNEEADFLGLVHRVDRACLEREIFFTPRPKLVEKAAKIIGDSLGQDSCTPASASKLRGILGFLFNGAYGRIGRGGQQALLQRQYVDTAPFSLSRTLRRSLQFMEGLLQVLPPRRVPLGMATTKPLVIASDGRQDSKGPPSISAVIIDIENGVRKAFVAVCPGALCARWETSDQCIALVEQAAIVMGLLAAPAMFIGRDVYWFEDNASVLAGVIKCSSREAELDAGLASIHTILAALQTRVWFEWVESKANWADGSSRLLEADPWVQKHGFEVARAGVPTWPWEALPQDRVTAAKELRASCDESSGGRTRAAVA